MYLYYRFKICRMGGWISSFLAAFARPAQGPRIDIPPPATVTGSLPCIECSADKILRVLSHGIWNRSCIANWNDGQLSKNGFHWENVKHLISRLALIHDSGTAFVFLYLLLEKDTGSDLSSCISCWKKDERVRVESLAAAYAQSKAQKRAETAPLS